MGHLNPTVICGFYGNGNLGDEAMLSGMIHLLRKRGQEHILVLSNNPEDTRCKHSVDAIHISKKRDFSKRVFESLRCQNFILGGGDLLRDSANSSVALDWLKHLKLALQLKRHTTILGISVGEIWRDETKEAIPKMLNQVQTIAVRDECSKNKLHALGVTKEIHVVGDLALNSVPNINLSNKSQSSRQLQVGVSVRHLVGRGRSINPAAYTHVLKEIVGAVDRLVDEFQAVVHYLPFRSFQDGYHSVDDDYVASLEALRFSRHHSQAVVHRHFTGADDFVSKIQNLDLVIGMRLHSLILSSAVGIPVLGVEYDTKVSSYMKEINQLENCISLDSISTVKLLENARRIIQTPQSYRAELTKSVRQYKEKLSEVEAKVFRV